MKFPLSVVVVVGGGGGGGGGGIGRQPAPHPSEVVKPP